MGFDINPAAVQSAWDRVAARLASDLPPAQAGVQAAADAERQRIDHPRARKQDDDERGDQEFNGHDGLHAAWKRQETPETGSWS